MKIVINVPETEVSSLLKQYGNVSTVLEGSFPIPNLRPTEPNPTPTNRRNGKRKGRRPTNDCKLWTKHELNVLKQEFKLKRGNESDMAVCRRIAARLHRTPIAIASRYYADVRK